MLPPAWGYVDQPPLVPFLARTLAGLVDEAWALRVPATVVTALSVVLVALISRELGGGRGAQALDQGRRRRQRHCGPGGEIEFDLSVPQAANMQRPGT